MTDEPKLLIIEDDEFLVKIYESKFKAAGFQVESALGGEEGVVMARSIKPDLILLDLIMPNKNGFQVLEELQADPEFKKIPVVVLSNLGQEADIKRALEGGAVDYIVKADVTLQDIIEKLKTYLKN